MLSYLSPVLTLLAAIPGPSQEPKKAAFPDTPAGKIAADFFDAQRAGTDAAAEAFESKWRSAADLEKKPAKARVAMWKQIRGLTGPLTAEKLIEAKASSIAILASSKKVPMRFRVELILDDDHKLDSIGVRPAASTQLKARSYDKFEDVRDLLRQVRRDTKIPAIAAAVVDGDAIADKAVVGVRQLGGEAVQPTDRFHVGSVTKSMTATMIATLVEAGKLSWDATLGDLLPGVEMHEQYASVTLAQLLRHRAGVPAHATFGQAEMKRLVELPGGPDRQRATYVAEVLRADPLGPAGKTYQYSNAGYAIAGHIAERATGETWESLMRTHVFKKFAMSSADIGWPATEKRRDQPRGHFPSGKGLRAQKVGEYPLGAFMGPAGNVCCSIADLASYARGHLAGLKDRSAPLAAKTIEQLHEPYAGSTGSERYAAGWMIRKIAGETVHWHNGSAGTFFAVVAICPAKDRAVVVATNTGIAASSVVDKVTEALLKR